MKVCVLGLWHLGSVNAAALASLGHQVTGLDFDAATVAALNQGVAPVFEPGLDQMLQRGLACGNLRFTTLIEAAVADAEILLVACDTPVDEDDIADVASVLAKIQRVLPGLAPTTTVLVSSQLPAGSLSLLEKFALEKLPALQLDFACVPENLRLGKALEVYLRPDRIVAGIRSARAKARIERLFEPIAARIEWMSVESAEMTKHALNSFLALSVAFANEIAVICERVGADAADVARALKTDQRIGAKAYLAPGGAFAGGTLARDIEFLTAMAANRQLHTPLLAAVKPSNDMHKSWARRRLQALFPELATVVVAIWGLTYKAGTDTLRRSMAVELCEWLQQQGALVHVHDPLVRELPAHWSGRVRRFEQAAAAVAGAQVLVIATEWPEYRDIDAAQLPDTGLVVLDANRFVAAFAKAPGLHYLSVGRAL